MEERSMVLILDGLLVAGGVRFGEGRCGFYTFNHIY
jgi:hypothetical protein